MLKRFGRILLRLSMIFMIIMVCLLGTVMLSFITAAGVPALGWGVLLTGKGDNQPNMEEYIEEIGEEFETFYGNTEGEEGDPYTNIPVARVPEFATPEPTPIPISEEWFDDPAVLPTIEALYKGASVRIGSTVGAVIGVAPAENVEVDDICSGHDFVDAADVALEDLASQIAADQNSTLNSVTTEFDLQCEKNVYQMEAIVRFPTSNSNGEYLVRLGNSGITRIPAPLINREVVEQLNQAEEFLVGGRPGQGFFTLIFQFIQRALGGVQNEKTANSCGGEDCHLALNQSLAVIIKVPFKDVRFNPTATPEINIRVRDPGGGAVSVPEISADGSTSGQLGACSNCSDLNTGVALAGDRISAIIVRNNNQLLESWSTTGANPGQSSSGNTDEVSVDAWYTEEEEVEFIVITKTPTPTPTPSPTPTFTPSPTPTEPPPDEDTCYVTTDSLNLRDSPNGEWLTTIPSDSTVVDAGGSPTEDGGFTWYNISWDGFTGWSASDWLSPTACP